MSLTAARQFVDGQYDKVEEELEELDESHDGEAEPQAEHTAQVRDVLQQLKHTKYTIRFPLTALVLSASGGKRYCFDRRLPVYEAKFHYAILIVDRSEAGCRPAASWNLAYHLDR